MAQIDVAIAQHADLPLHQRHGGARGVGDADQAEKFWIVLKIIRVLRQEIAHIVVIHSAPSLAVFQSSRAPSKLMAVGPLKCIGWPSPAQLTTS